MQILNYSTSIIKDFLLGPKLPKSIKMCRTQPKPRKNTKKKGLGLIWKNIWAYENGAIYRHSRITKFFFSIKQKIFDTFKMSKTHPKPRK